MRKFAICPVLLILSLLAVSTASFGQVVISVAIAPPALPVYVQPVCPGDGYIWTPGYWAWDADGDDYYWVPGTWVLVPQVGFFWTPGYWGWGNGFYIWHVGYWGPVVGFYGGINYGFGYFGHGYYGGRWEGGHFFYNREVNNVNVTIIHNVYNEHVDVRGENHISYNGGRGGINERPTREDEAAERERHIAPVSDQVRHEQAARSNQELRASYNHGKPPVAATARPGVFNEHVPAKEAGGTYNPPPKGGGSHNPPASAIHPKELPSYERPPAPNTGNPKQDQKYQQQQEKLAAKQEQQRQQLQQKQEQEHQRMQQQNANQERVQQMEQRHLQQTQQMYQKHTQQQQTLQTKQQPSHQGGGKPH